MKKFIFNTVFFLLFSSIFYVTLLFFWESFASSQLKPNINYHIGSYGHLYSRLSEVKNYGKIDVLFLGSSHTYRGFDTRIFLENGYKSFNLGSSSQTPAQTKVLLNRYLDSLQPELVIYEVYPVIFELDGVESSLDLISNDINDLHSIKMALEINNIRVYNTLIYALTRDLLGLNNSFSESIKKGKDTYISGGYVEKELDYYKPSEFEKKEIALRDNQLESFLDIVKMVKDRNIELILVYTPIPKVNYESYCNNHYFDSIMSRYSEYYNFNEIITLDDSNHFYDSHHLNQYGVKIVNEKLIELMNKNKTQHNNSKP